MKAMLVLIVMTASVQIAGASAAPSSSSASKFHTPAPKAEYKTVALPCGKVTVTRLDANSNPPEKVATAGTNTYSGAK